jgi:aerobic-type carbon monoxide dehydrogenase small subunit (CoxS/CutS family)
VLVDGVEIRSCVTPTASVAGKSITTLEGLAALYAEHKGLPEAPALHPLQQAFIDEQAIQCGYCYNGMTVKAFELLSQNPKPTEAQIRSHMNGHLCRCGTYARITKSIQLASTRMAGDTR